VVSINGKRKNATNKWMLLDIDKFLEEIMEKTG